MSNETQMRDAALDAHRNPVAGMVAGDFGDVVTIDLDTVSGTPILLSAATDYPDGPVVVLWILQNFNSGILDTALVSGIFLDRSSGGAVNVPGVLGMRSDPGKMSLVQNSGGPLTYRLTLEGKNLEAPSP